MTARSLQSRPDGPAPALADQEQRWRIRHDLDSNLVVEAAAGTGKTTELVNRIVSVLAHGRTTVDRLVAVTFTEKAAGELKLRLRAEMEHARQRAREAAATATALESPLTHAPQVTHGREAAHAREVERRLEAALARLEEARVGTIHSFCGDLLRERSIEACIDPRFRTMTEPEAKRLLGEVFHLWLQEKLEDPPEGVRRSLRRRSSRQRGGPEQDEGRIERLEKAAWMLGEWRDFRAPWRREPLDRAGRIDALLKQLSAFAALTRSCARPAHDTLYQATEPARALADIVSMAEQVRGRDHDGLEGQLIALIADRDFRSPRIGTGKSYGPGVLRDDVRQAHLALCAALESFARDADADLASLLQSELLEVVDRYEARKQREGRLDFFDLLGRTRDLLRCREVREEFQRRFTHLFVDEFQDTDPLQAEILLLLCSDDPETVDWRQVRPVAGKLFVVADPKQSIYRFRRADVGTYLEVRDRLRAQGAGLLQLSVSFRSVPGIQRVVNAAFAGLMNGDASAHQPEYVPLRGVRSEPAGQPSVIALSVPEPFGWRGSVTKTAVAQSLPRAVAGFVEWLLTESGWTVTERESPGARVPVQARHICLLFRRFDGFFEGDVTRGYVRSLEARGIRHLLIGGRSFHEREEVEMVRTALTAVEWPEDELAVFATLRGPLFAIHDEELLQYRRLHGALHPFASAAVASAQPAAEAACRPVIEALGILRTLHRKRNRRPVSETIHALLEQTRAQAALVLRPSGEQALANVLHMAEQARIYEGGGGISFRGFVERLLDEAGRAGSPEAPILEEGSDGVRIMTVHKAKGLEFPVVILCDITKSLSMASASRTIDQQRNFCALRLADWSPWELREAQDRELGRDAAEGVRLAYVASTRARDLLVVPAVGDGPLTGGWISPFNEAIYPPRTRWRKPEAAPGCPEFGRDTVLSRPEASLFGGICPGLFPMGSESEPYGVVWWDPACLPPAAEEPKGLRNQDLISKDVDPKTVRADLDRYEAWQAARESAIQDGARPSLVTRTVTQVAGEAAPGRGVTDATRDDLHPGNEDDDAGAARGHHRRLEDSRLEPRNVELVELPVEAGRPAGPRFGALVHAALSLVPLEAGQVEIEEVARLEARILGADEAELAAAIRAVKAVLEHPILERAREAAARGQCRRETPVAWRQPDGALLEGVIDLAFPEESGWIVLDFKTDRDIARDLDRYRTQVAIYARAIAAATGAEARGVLLRV